MHKHGQSVIFWFELVDTDARDTLICLCSIYSLTQCFANRVCLTHVIHMTLRPFYRPSLFVQLRSIKKFVTYTVIHSMYSAFNPSKCTRLEQWEPREQLGVWCLAQGSHLSHGQFLPEPRFEPTTSGYKSNALSIRPQLPLGTRDNWNKRKKRHWHWVALVWSVYSTYICYAVTRTMRLPLGQSFLFCWILV